LHTKIVQNQAVLTITASLTMMSKKTILLLALFLPILAAAQVRVENPKIENLSNPLGLDITQPRFGWQLSAERRQVRQTAYEIQVVAKEADFNNPKKELWNSGKISSDASAWAPYQGPALQSGKKYWWRVRVWDENGAISNWSTPAFWQMGLLSTSDWKAQWITEGAPMDTSGACQQFRKEFRIQKKMVAATAFITAHGMYEACINGKRIGNDYLTPAGRPTKNAFNTRCMM
jgi:alpha-L-rhamnosidase